MGENLFDFFGGMANLPEDPSDDELDLTDLESASQDSTSSDVEQVAEASSDVESYASNERAEAAKNDRTPKEPLRPGQTEDTHWLDLASSLGVAIGSTQFEQSANQPAQPPSRTPATRKPARPAAKPAPTSSGKDDSAFGKGLLDDAPESDEEHRQKQLLSELFVPTGEAFEEPDGAVRQVDDVEIIDDEIADDEMIDDEMIDDEMIDDELIDEELVDEELIEDGLIDDEMVEFEVEELSSGEEQGRSEFGRRPQAPRDIPPRRREPIEPVGPPDAEEPKRDRPHQRNRDEGPHRRPRRGDRDRGRAPSGSNRPPHHEKKVRSQVLPADEDFIIDPIDDDLANESEEVRPDAAGTKSIKFPTWNETVSPIIEANIARRGKSKGRPRRPPNRDRGGGE